MCPDVLLRPACDCARRGCSAIPARVASTVGEGALVGHSAVGAGVPGDAWADAGCICARHNWLYGAHARCFYSEAREYHPSKRRLWN